MSKAKLCCSALDHVSRCSPSLTSSRLHPACIIIIATRCQESKRLDELLNTPDRDGSFNFFSAAQGNDIKLSKKRLLGVNSSFIRRTMTSHHLDKKRDHKTVETVNAQFCHWSRFRSIWWRNSSDPVWSTTQFDFAQRDKFIKQNKSFFVSGLNHFRFSPKEKKPRSETTAEETSRKVQALITHCLYSIS